MTLHCTSAPKAYIPRREWGRIETKKIDAPRRRTIIYARRLDDDPHARELIRVDVNPKFGACSDTLLDNPFFARLKMRRSYQESIPGKYFGHRDHVHDNWWNIESQFQVDQDRMFLNEQLERQPISQDCVVQRESTESKGKPEEKKLPKKNKKPPVIMVHNEAQTMRVYRKQELPPEATRRYRAKQQKKVKRKSTKKKTKERRVRSEKGPCSSFNILDADSSGFENQTNGILESQALRDNKNDIADLLLIKRQSNRASDSEMRQQIRESILKLESAQRLREWTENHRSLFRMDGSPLSLVSPPSASPERSVSSSLEGPNISDQYDSTSHTEGYTSSDIGGYSSPLTLESSERELIPKATFSRSSSRVYDLDQEDPSLNTSSSEISLESSFDSRELDNYSTSELGDTDTETNMRAYKDHLSEHSSEDEGSTSLSISTELMDLEIEMEAQHRRLIKRGVFTQHDIDRGRNRH